MSQDIQSIVKTAARQYGVSEIAMLGIAQLESSMGTRLKNPKSSAGGVFQFIDKTWAAYGRGKSKFDPVANSDAGARFTRDNANSLRKALGREPTDGELYLAHQQGAGGAIALLKNPNASAVAIVGSDEVRLNGGNAGMTAGQFAGLWTKKMDRAVARLGGASAPTVIRGNATAPAIQGDPSPNTTAELMAVQPQVPATTRQLHEEAIRQETQPKIGALEAWDNAVLDNSALGALSKWWERPELAPDPTFRLDLKGKHADILKEIPEPYWDRLDAAHSEAHLLWLADDLREEVKRQTELDRLGAWGIAAQIGAALTDPVALVAGLGIGKGIQGAGLAAKVAQRYGTFGTIGLGAAEGAAGNLVTDGLIAANSHTFGTENLIYSAGAGLIVGGTMSSLINGVDTSASRRFARLGADMQDEAADMALLRVGRGSIGASEVGPMSELGPKTYDHLKAAERVMEDKQNNIFNMFDGSVTARLKASPNPYTNMLGEHLAEYGARNAKGVTEMSASERATRMERVYNARWRTASDPAFKEWYNDPATGARGSGPFAKADARHEFDEAVTEAVRRGANHPAHPSVKKAADEFRAQMREWVEIMNNPAGLDGESGRPIGDGNLRPNPNYVPRVFHPDKLRKVFTEFDEDTLTEFVAEAVDRARPGLPRELRLRFSKQYLRKIYQMDASQHALRAQAVSGVDKAALKEWLQEGTDLTDADLDQVLDAIPSSATSSKAGKSDASQAHYRNFLDENLEMQIRNKDGTLVPFKFTDLTNNSADFLLETYNRQMSGRVALARTRIVVDDLYAGEGEQAIINGILNDGEFERILERTAEIGRDKGMSRAAIEKDLNRLQFLYDSILGRPTKGQNPGSTFDDSLRRIRDWNFLRVAGRFGLAQVNEASNIMGEFGVRAAIRHMPMLSSLRRDILAGNVEPGILKEFSQATGLGLDGTRMNMLFRQNEYDNVAVQSAGKGRWARIDQAMHSSKNFMNQWMNGMNAANTYLHRWAGNVMWHRFDDWATGVKKITDMDYARMQDMGVAKDDAERILGQIKKHRVVGKDGELKSLGLDKWEDLGIQSKFEDMTFRWGRTMVQENDIGNLYMWMSHPLAQTFMQFRTFMVGSVPKQLFQKTNMAGRGHLAPVAKAMIASAGLGYLSYLAQMGFTAAGREDAQKYLEDNLRASRVVPGVMTKMGTLSIGQPFISVLARLSGYNDPFTSRTSGLAGDPIFGSPTGDLLEKIYSAPGHLKDFVENGELNQQGVRGLMSLLMFQNAIGITQIINAMNNDLPRRAPRDAPGENDLLSWLDE